MPSSDPRIAAHCSLLWGRQAEYRENAGFGQGGFWGQVSHAVAAGETGIFQIFNKISSCDVLPRGKCLSGLRSNDPKYVDLP